MTDSIAAIAIQEKQKISTRQKILLLSPILVLIICQIAGRLLAPVFGNWSIYPWLLIYWAVTGVLTLWGGGNASLRRWAGKPRGSWLWSALPLIFIPMTIPIFLDGWQILKSGWIWLPWLLFPPINSLFEEGYWRGLLLDAGRKWPGWAIILYASLLFSLNHLSLGAFVETYRGWFPLVSPFMAGLILGIVYWKTGSLRWTVVFHTLVNWLSLAILVLMNRYLPAMMP